MSWTVATAQPTPAKLALARETIAAMQADRMFDAMAAQLKQMYAQAVPAPANATTEQRQKVETVQTQIAQLLTGGIDLSVSGLVALTTVAAAALLRDGFHRAPQLIAAVAAQ